MKKFSIKVLSLIDAYERREKVVTEFSKKSKMEFSFFNGVYGKNISNKELARIYDAALAKNKINRDLTSGEIGATYSHYLMYVDSYDNGDEFLIVLEDDCYLDLSFDSVLLSILEKTDSVIDEIIFIQAHTSNNKHVIKSINNKNVNESFSLHRILGSSQYFIGAYGYIVTRAAMKKLIDTYLPIYCVCDHWYFIKKKSKIKTFSALYPAIVFTNEESVRKVDSYVEMERRELSLFKPVGYVAKLKIFIKKMILPIINKDWE